MFFQRTYRFCATALVLMLLASVSTAAASARDAKGTARAAMTVFADNCFSPFMTAMRAERAFAITGVSYDFYDLDPFSSATPSPALGRAITAGTDRRCEISFVGAFGPQAADVAIAALVVEGLHTTADVPAQFILTKSTSLLAARRLNPTRVAVVHVGTRTGTQGIETFMLVERLLPEHGKG